MGRRKLQSSCTPLGLSVEKASASCQCEECEHSLFCRNGAQKLLGVLITIGEAVAYVVSGMYGDVRELGAVNATLIILQVLNTCSMSTRMPRLGFANMTMLRAVAARFQSSSWQ